MLASVLDSYRPKRFPATPATKNANAAAKQALIRRATKEMWLQTGPSAGSFKTATLSKAYTTESGQLKLPTGGSLSGLDNIEKLALLRRFELYPDTSVLDLDGWVVQRLKSLEQYGEFRPTLVEWINLSSDQRRRVLRREETAQTISETTGEAYREGIAAARPPVPQQPRTLTIAERANALPPLLPSTRRIRQPPPTPQTLLNARKTLSPLIRIEPPTTTPRPTRPPPPTPLTAEAPLTSAGVGATAGASRSLAESLAKSAFPESQ
jgi:hypothetical protein